MCDKQRIISNIGYTELVYGRINKKLGFSLEPSEIEDLITEILTECDEENYMKVGKNYYAKNLIRKIRVTINSHTFRIITVDRLINANQPCTDLFVPVS